MALAEMVLFDLMAEEEANAYRVRNAESDGCAALEAEVGNISPRNGPAKMERD